MIRNINRITQICSKHKKQFATTIIHNQYNFFIDFKGLMYFDDGTPMIYPNCIKDLKFINQMYKNLKKEQFGEYQYVAEFWGERNRIRCAISPIIYHSLHEDRLRFSFQQQTEFKPEELRMDSDGRIWHPYRDGIEGVFSNDMLVQIMDKITTKDGKTFLDHKQKKYEIVGLS